MIRGSAPLAWFIGFAAGALTIGAIDYQSLTLATFTAITSLVIILFTEWPKPPQ